MNDFVVSKFTYLSSESAGYSKSRILSQFRLLKNPVPLRLLFDSGFTPVLR